MLAGASAGSAEAVLYSRRSDPVLAEAFAGRSEVTETRVSEGVLVSSEPVADAGYVVMANVPTQEAFAGVAALNSTALRVAGVLALTLIAGAFMFVRAVRLRQIAEASVRSAEIRVRTILDAARDGFIAMDEDGVVTGWNAAAADLFGWTADEAIGQRLSVLIVPPEQREAYTQRLQRFLRTGEGCVVNQRVAVGAVDRAGRTFTVELAVTAAKVNNAWMFNAFVHDVSERRLHELELAQARDHALAASQLKSEFIANMSHEIRTPMNGVLGMTSLLLDSDLNTAQREDAETVLRSGESLLAIIDDILDFSKIEAGQLALEAIEFGPQHLIGDVTGLLAMRAAEKGIELVAYVHSDVPACVTGDPGRIRQILTNLLDNAIKFTDSGEVVLEVSVEAQPRTTATAAPDRVLRFEVTDTGIGIGVDNQAMIFESFRQADSSTTRRYGGTGLGLAISQLLVTMMNGQIGVRSTVGTGSAFWFTLPTTIGKPLHASSSRASRHRHQGASELPTNED